MALWMDWRGVRWDVMAVEVQAKVEAKKMKNKTLGPIYLFFQFELSTKISVEVQRCLCTLLC